jgi:hypothetical protein
VTTTTDERLRSDAAIGVAARRMVFVSLFVVGIVLGGLAFRNASPTIDYGPNPPLPEVAEPAAADKLTDLLANGDDAGLAASYDSTVLGQLADAMKVAGQTPLSDVSDVKYLGAVRTGPDTIAMYLAKGSAGNMGDAGVAFSVRVRDGKVVGVD